MGKENKTSLEKSHSAWSNTKLTTLCVLTVLFVSAFWLSLGLFTKITEMTSNVVAIIIVAVTFVLSALGILGFSKFTR